MTTQPSEPPAHDKQRQANNPLHGITLEQMINQLVDYYSWVGLGTKVRINCFTKDPSVKSSLKFLRKTPWARAEVEALYLKSVKKPNFTTPNIDNTPPPGLVIEDC